MKQVAKAIVRQVEPYQPDKDKIIFFFEGKTLDKPGRPTLPAATITKRAKKLNKVIRKLYLKQRSKQCPDDSATKKTLSREMGRPEWWFTVKVCDHLRGNSGKLYAFLFISSHVQMTVTLSTVSRR